ncbi:hypothetical protein RIR_jg31944.t1 [Rhizophagus irregularis DAOM 181602=DAOM 197198]|nr:hypothetical protein RIR_jg31944.t1 [Rhizophagus irregularis DAOM 181602=DAOM 197198]
MCPLQEKIKRTWTRHTQLNRESDAGAIYYTCRIKNFDENGHILSLLPFGEVKKQLKNNLIELRSNFGARWRKKDEIRTSSEID